MSLEFASLVLQTGSGCQRCLHSSGATESRRQRRLNRIPPSSTSWIQRTPSPDPLQTSCRRESTRPSTLRRCLCRLDRPDSQRKGLCPTQSAASESSSSQGLPIPFHPVPSRALLGVVPESDPASGRDVGRHRRRRSNALRCAQRDSSSETASGSDDSASTSSNSATAGTSDYERLFSNLNQATLRHEPGSLTSSILLVAGTTVGAGILAIPAVTQESGFLASAVTCTGCWLYMVATGLLVAEVNVNTMCELGSGGVSLVSMAERTLGKVGVQVSCLTYVFIHYALLVAYVARSADIITGATGLPEWASAAAFSLSLGALCYFGSQRVVGAVNGGLVVGVLSSFLFLLLVASNGIALEPLLRANFEAVPTSIPIIALSFVYQNVVPVVATNMEGNLGRIRTSIVAGTAIPLVMFLLWNAVILGTMPQEAALEGVVGGGASLDGVPLVDPIARLQELGGTVGGTVQVFSFFAIATSYIGFVLGLTDFLSDWLRLPVSRTQLLPHALTVLPPIALALLNPDIFFQALDVAGTYGVLVLFGIIPAAMAWSERYSAGVSPPFKKPLVPGGQLTLLLIFSGAGIVITNEVISSFFS